MYIPTLIKRLTMILSVFKSIKHRLLIISLLPTLIISTFLFQLLLQENENVYDANYSLEAVTLFNALDNVAHNFAVEFNYI